MAHARRLEHSGLDLTQIHHPVASTELREWQLAINQLTPTRVVRALVAGMSWPTQADFEQLRSLPVLVIQGEYDAVTTVRGMEPLKGWLGPSTEIVIVENAGHNVMVERPAVVNDLMLAFARKVLKETS